MLIEIEKVDPADDASGTADKDEYAIIVPNQSNGTAIHTTAVDGAATATIKAQSRIGDAQTIYIEATDKSQWDN